MKIVTFRRPKDLHEKKEKAKRLAAATSSTAKKDVGAKANNVEEQRNKKTTATTSTTEINKNLKRPATAVAGDEKNPKIAKKEAAAMLKPSSSGGSCDKTKISSSSGAAAGNNSTAVKSKTILDKNGNKIVKKQTANAIPGTAAKPGKSAEQQKQKNKAAKSSSATTAMNAAAAAIAKPGASGTTSAIQTTSSADGPRVEKTSSSGASSGTAKEDPAPEQEEPPADDLSTAEILLQKTSSTTSSQKKKHDQETTAVNIKAEREKNAANDEKENTATTQVEVASNKVKKKQVGFSAEVEEHEQKKVIVKKMTKPTGKADPHKREKSMGRLRFEKDALKSKASAGQTAAESSTTTTAATAGTGLTDGEQTTAAAAELLQVESTAIDAASSKVKSDGEEKKTKALEDNNKPSAAEMTEPKAVATLNSSTSYTLPPVGATVKLDAIWYSDPDHKDGGEYYNSEEDWDWVVVSTLRNGYILIAKLISHETVTGCETYSGTVEGSVEGETKQITLYEAGPLGFVDEGSNGHDETDITSGTLIPQGVARLGLKIIRAKDVEVCMENRAPSFALARAVRDKFGFLANLNQTLLAKYTMLEALKRICDLRIRELTKKHEKFRNSTTMKTMTSTELCERRDNWRMLKIWTIRLKFLQRELKPLENLSEDLQAKRNVGEYIHEEKQHPRTHLSTKDEYIERYKDEKTGKDEEKESPLLPLTEAFMEAFDYRFRDADWLTHFEGNNFQQTEIDEMAKYVLCEDNKEEAKRRDEYPHKEIADIDAMLDEKAQLQENVDYHVRYDAKTYNKFFTHHGENREKFGKFEENSKLKNFCVDENKWKGQDYEKWVAEYLPQFEDFRSEISETDYQDLIDDYNDEEEMLLHGCPLDTQFTSLTAILRLRDAALEGGKSTRISRDSGEPRLQDFTTLCKEKEEEKQLLLNACEPTEDGLLVHVPTGEIKDPEAMFSPEKVLHSRAVIVPPRMDPKPHSKKVPAAFENGTIYDFALAFDLPADEAFLEPWMRHYSEQNFEALMEPLVDEGESVLAYKKKIGDTIFNFTMHWRKVIERMRLLVRSNLIFQEVYKYYPRGMAQEEGDPEIIPTTDETGRLIDDLHQRIDYSMLKKRILLHDLTMQFVKKHGALTPEQAQLRREAAQDVDLYHQGGIPKEILTIEQFDELKAKERAVEEAARLEEERIEKEKEEQKRLEEQERLDEEKRLEEEKRLQELEASRRNEDRRSRDNFYKNRNKDDDSDDVVIPRMTKDEISTNISQILYHKPGPRRPDPNHDVASGMTLIQNTTSGGGSGHLGAFVPHRTNSGGYNADSHNTKGGTSTLDLHAKGGAFRNHHKYGFQGNEQPNLLMFYPPGYRPLYHAQKRHKASRSGGETTAFDDIWVPEQNSTYVSVSEIPTMCYDDASRAYYFPSGNRFKWHDLIGVSMRGHVGKFDMHKCDVMFINVEFTKHEKDAHLFPREASGCSLFGHITDLLIKSDKLDENGEPKYYADTYRSKDSYMKEVFTRHTETQVEFILVRDELKPHRVKASRIKVLDYPKDGHRRWATKLDEREVPSMRQQEEDVCLQKEKILTQWTAHVERMHYVDFVSGKGDQQCPGNPHLKTMPSPMPLNQIYRGSIQRIMHKRDCFFIAENYREEDPTGVWTQDVFGHINEFDSPFAVRFLSERTIVEYELRQDWKRPERVMAAHIKVIDKRFTAELATLHRALAIEREKDEKDRGIRYKDDKAYYDERTRREEKRREEKRREQVEQEKDKEKKRGGVDLLPRTTSNRDQDQTRKKSRSRSRKRTDQHGYRDDKREKRDAINDRHKRDAERAKEKLLEEQAAEKKKIAALIESLKRWETSEQSPEEANEFLRSTKTSDIVKVVGDTNTDKVLRAKASTVLTLMLTTGVSGDNSPKKGEVGDSTAAAEKKDEKKDDDDRKGEMKRDNKNRKTSRSPVARDRREDVHRERRRSRDRDAARDKEKDAKVLAEQALVDAPEYRTVRRRKQPHPLSAGAVFRGTIIQSFPKFGFCLIQIHGKEHLAIWARVEDFPCMEEDMVLHNQCFFTVCYTDQGIYTAKGIHVLRHEVPPDPDEPEPELLYGLLSATEPLYKAGELGNNAAANNLKLSDDEKEDDDRDKHKNAFAGSSKFTSKSSLQTTTTSDLVDKDVVRGVGTTAANGAPSARGAHRSSMAGSGFHKSRSEITSKDSASSSLNNLPPAIGRDNTGTTGNKDNYREREQHQHRDRNMKRDVLPPPTPGGGRANHGGYIKSSRDHDHHYKRGHLRDGDRSTRHRDHYNSKRGDDNYHHRGERSTRVDADHHLRSGQTTSRNHDRFFKRRSRSRDKDHHKRGRSRSGGRSRAGSEWYSGHGAGAASTRHNDYNHRSRRPSTAFSSRGGSNYPPGRNMVLDNRDKLKTAAAATSGALGGAVVREGDPDVPPPPPPPPEEPLLDSITGEPLLPAAPETSGRGPLLQPINTADIEIIRKRMEVAMANRS
ncbi:unnamed protein product [Amoebophrya sp. A120]|nr:unnamed protein product [Amoebophrya sp. A120]|eukprot:GSA120T00013898001.1